MANKDEFGVNKETKDNTESGGAIWGAPKYITSAARLGVGQLLQTPEWLYNKVIRPPGTGESTIMQQNFGDRQYQAVEKAFGIKPGAGEATKVEQWFNPIIDALFGAGKKEVVAESRPVAPQQPTAPAQPQPVQPQEPTTPQELGAKVTSETTTKEPTFNETYGAAPQTTPYKPPEGWFHQISPAYSTLKGDTPGIYNYQYKDKNGKLISVDSPDKIPESVKNAGGVTINMTSVPQSEADMLAKLKKETYGIATRDTKAGFYPQATNVLLDNNIAQQNLGVTMRGQDVHKYSVDVEKQKNAIEQKWKISEKNLEDPLEYIKLAMQMGTKTENKVTDINTGATSQVTSVDAKEGMRQLGMIKAPPKGIEKVLLKTKAFHDDFDNGRIEVEKDPTKAEELIKRLKDTYPSINRQWFEQDYFKYNKTFKKIMLKQYDAMYGSH